MAGLAGALFARATSPTGIFEEEAARRKSAADIAREQAAAAEIESRTALNRGAEEELRRAKAFRTLQEANIGVPSLAELRRQRGSLAGARAGNITTLTPFQAENLGARTDLAREQAEDLRTFRDARRRYIESGAEQRAAQADESRAAALFYEDRKRLIEAQINNLNTTAEERQRLLDEREDLIRAQARNQELLGFYAQYDRYLDAVRAARGQAGQPGTTVQGPPPPPPPAPASTPPSPTGGEAGGADVRGLDENELIVGENTPFRAMGTPGVMNNISRLRSLPPENVQRGFQNFLATYAGAPISSLSPSLQEQYSAFRIYLDSLKTGADAGSLAGTQVQPQGVNTVPPTTPQEVSPAPASAVPSLPSLDSIGNALRSGGQALGAVAQQAGSAIQRGLPQLPIQPGTPLLLPDSLINLLRRGRQSLGGFLGQQPSPASSVTSRPPNTAPTSPREAQRKTARRVLGPNRGSGRIPQ